MMPVVPSKRLKCSGMLLRFFGQLLNYLYFWSFWLTKDTVSLCQTSQKVKDSSGVFFCSPPRLVHAVFVFWGRVYFLFFPLICVLVCLLFFFVFNKCVLRCFDSWHIDPQHPPPPEISRFEVAKCSHWVCELLTTRCLILKTTFRFPTVLLFGRFHTTSPQYRFDRKQESFHLPKDMVLFHLVFKGI